MEKNKIITIGELILELMDQFLDSGELSETDWAIYISDEAKLSRETVCCVADNTTFTDDDEELYPNFAIENNMRSYIYSDLLNDVLTAFLAKKRTAGVDELIAALEYYLENDCFLEPEGELNDPNQNPKVILAKTPEDKMKVLLKIKKAFGLDKTMKELLKSANNAPEILTESLSFSEAKKIIDNNDLSEWVTVKF